MKKEYVYTKSIGEAPKAKQKQVLCLWLCENYYCNKKVN